MSPQNVLVNFHLVKNVLTDSSIVFALLTGNKPYKAGDVQASSEHGALGEMKICSVPLTAFFC